MNRAALITGAGGDLAQATARLLAEAGWDLALVGRDSEAMQGLQDELLQDMPTGQGTIILVEADISTGEGAFAAVAAARELLEQPLTALAACAGSVVLQAGHQTTQAQFRDVMAANLDTAFFSLGAFTDQLLKDRTPGAAVLVSSVAAQVGIPRHEAIAAAKGGVEALVRSAAATYAARGLRVNAVAPGLMRTRATERFFGNEQMAAAMAAQYPLGRWGEVMDVARAIAWLLGAESSWVTGQTLTIDGGYGSLKTMPRLGARP